MDPLPWRSYSPTLDFILSLLKWRGLGQILRIIISLEMYAGTTSESGLQMLFLHKSISLQ
jgi:hypothetical protein